MAFLTLILLVGLAVAAVRTRDLLAAVAILGAYSLMMAVLWSQMNALDVAFTEAAVGAGIATMLLLAALLRVGAKEKTPSNHLLRHPLMTMQDLARRMRRDEARRSSMGAIVVCLLVGAALLYGTWDMPQVGDASSPANTHEKVAEHYISKSRGEVGPSNFVTSVLGDYRGYDTMGETVVIFTAALCVLLLLRHGTAGRRDED